MLFFHTKVYFITFCKQLQHWYILMINMLPLYRTQIIIYMCEIIMFLASRYIINNVCSKWCIINAKIACTYILGQSDVNWGYKTYTNEWIRLVLQLHILDTLICTSFESPCKSVQIALMRISWRVLLMQQEKLLRVKYLSGLLLCLYLSYASLGLFCLHAVIVCIVFPN